MRRHHQGAIGVAVGVATAGVIALLVLTDDEPSEPRDSARAFTLPAIPKTLPTPKKPSKVVPEPEPPAPEPPKPVDPQDATRALFDGALSKNGVLATLRSLDGFDQLAKVDGRHVASDSGFGVGTGTLGRVGPIGRRDRSISGPPLPRVELGSVVVTTLGAAAPGFTAARVRVNLRRAIRRVQACFESKPPGMTITIPARFSVSASGRITAVTATGDPDLASCVAKVVESIELSWPDGTGGVDVVASFTFES